MKSRSARSPRLMPGCRMGALARRVAALPIAGTLGLLVLSGAAPALTLGNNPADGGALDGWDAIMVVNENDTHTNETASPQTLTLTDFNFNAGASRGRVTPFVVRINGDNDFTVLAIGRTRVAAADYPTAGVYSLPFSDTPTAVIVNPGETLAVGFTDANPDGTDNAGSVIPFGDGGDEIWLTGGPATGNSGQLSQGAPPHPGAQTYNTLTRQYAFNIAIVVGTPAPQPPTRIDLTAGALFPGTAPGTGVGTFTSIDPNPGDQHAYTLIDDAAGRFTLDGATLKTAQPLGPVGTSYSLRVRSTDSAGLFLESDFQLSVTDASVVLNEFVASNDTGLRDETGAREDWIELHNPLDTPVNLAGWRLTDTPGGATAWTLPDRTLAPGGFLVIFASGKNRSPATGTLHTDFRIDGSSGEYLALLRPDGSIADSVDPQPQFSDLAWGRGANATGRGYLTPTPAAANGPAFTYGLNEVHFSVKRGFYAQAQTLTLTADVPGSVIRFTTNGSRPTATNGQTYDNPIPIAPDTAGSTRGTRRIRAIALNPQAAANRIATHTYLFTNGVTSPAADGLTGQTNSNNTTQTNAIKNNPTYGPLLGDSLTSVSAVSINLAASLPSASESAASIEFIHPADDEPGFQIDCGIQAVGGHSIGSPKNNFRLYFRSQYGSATLNHNIFRNHPYSQFHPPAEKFDRIALRSGSHDSFFWMADTANPPMAGTRGDALYLRAAVMDDLHLNMGHAAPHNRYVQLWMNGRYHGLYHWREYPNNDFMASYHPGSSDDYEFTNGANAGENGSATWQSAWAKLRAAVAAGYSEASRWINLPQFADFIVLNLWAGNAWDWNPNQNWMAAGPKLPDRGGWVFFSYDNDVIWNDANANLTIPTSPYYVNNPRPGVMPPDGLMVTTSTTDTTLIDHPEFRVLFRDRFYKACFHGGPLDAPRAQAILDRRVEEIRLPLVAETSRWQPSSATRLPWDRDGEWTAEVNRIRNTFMAGRVATLLAQIKARGWYPVDAPEFAQHGGVVAAGTQPAVTSATPGTEVLATLDGSDPRLPGGAVNPSALALTEPLPAAYAVTGPVTIRVRARRSTDGEWSPLNEAAFFTVQPVPATAASLVITEIHYHPAANTVPATEEFLEVLNVGTAPIDLGGCHFTRGLDYVFPPATVLGPGHRLTLTESQFLNGTGLSDGGERLTLVQPDGTPIRDFTYADTMPWPESPDGTGPSLVLAAADVLHATDAWHANGLNWHASTTPGGTPGSVEPGGYDAWKSSHGGLNDADDTDGDSLTSLMEFVTGSDPLAASAAHLPVLDAQPPGLRLQVVLNASLSGVAVALESSPNLDDWSPASPPVVSRQPLGTIEKVTFLLPQDTDTRYWRLRATATP